MAIRIFLFLFWKTRFGLPQYISYIVWDINARHTLYKFRISAHNHCILFSFLLGGGAPQPLQCTVGRLQKRTGGRIWQWHCAYWTCQVLVSVLQTRDRLSETGEVKSIFLNSRSFLFSHRKTEYLRICEDDGEVVVPRIIFWTSSSQQPDDELHNIELRCINLCLKPGNLLMCARLNLFLSVRLALYCLHRYPYVKFCWNWCHRRE